MRTLLCIALVVAACAPGEKKAAAPAGAQKYTGTWEGRSHRSPSDTGVPFRTIISVAPDGSLRGTLMFTSITASPVPIRVREYSDTSFVQEVGPYHSPTLDRDVVSRAVGHVQGDSLTGTYEGRPVGGGDVILKGTFRAKKVS